METIGRRIKEMRKLKNLKQKEVARIIGISQGSLSDIESDRNKPSIETLIAVSDLFDISIDWIVKGENKEHKNF